MIRLSSDPARQAHDPIRGYIYQILRSISVWLELGDGEKLYLEGAEDLDRIDEDVALTEQVKDTIGSGNITLRTPSVVEAVNNFWNHRTRNPEITIRFRYVTTSGIGVEKGAPFGAGQSGLALWNAVRFSETGTEADGHITSIAKFLREEGGLSTPIDQFISTAGPQEILQQLIRPMEWFTGQQDGEALERQIKDWLVTHGATLSIPPADAELAFNPLYSAAFEAAKTKDGIPLTRALFLRIFAGATGVHVPKQDLLALIKAAVSPGDEMAIYAPSLSLEGPPPLPAHYFRRTAIEQELDAGLTNGAALLYGSTGSSKTLTAASTLRDRNSLWLTLRDLKPAEVKTRLTAAAEQLRHSGEAISLVVDDLDALSDSRLIEASLGALWRCQKALRGQLIVTADRPLPARLAQAIELDAAREFQMQPFDTVDIEMFLRQSGCLDERAEMWSKVLELSTLGHPQLVNARVATLRANQFPLPGASDFLGTAEDVDRIRFEARTIIAELPEGARELLLRASLLTGRVNRQRLIAIGLLHETIAEPGAAVDIIAGPWLELTDNREFRVSPLARGAAVELRGQEWVKAMHGQLAWTYLLDRTVTPWDISSILMHCYIAGTAGPLMHVMQGMFSASDEVWAAVGEACSFYAELGLDESAPLPFTQPLDLFVFRIFQYRIAAETDTDTDTDTAMRIALKLEEEFASAPDDDAHRFFRFLYLTQLLSIAKVRYPIPFVVARALEFIDAGKALETSFPDRMARAGIDAGEELPVGSYTQFVSLRLFMHIQNIDELVALFDVLKTRTSEEACELLESIDMPDHLSSSLIDRLWLTQHNLPDAQWPVFREKLRAAFDFSVEVSAKSMARAIAPVLLRIINEDIGDPAGAIAEAQNLEPFVGDDPTYQCAFAKITSDAGDFLKVKELWRDALSRWPNAEEDLGCAFAHRTAAIASGRNGEWVEAAAYFDVAQGLVKDNSRPTFTIGLAIDAAFARFMAGQRDEAVRELGTALTELEPMQADYELEPLLSLQRRAGGVFSAVAGWTEGERTETELSKLVGLCSNLDPFETDASIAPPLDTLRLDFLRIALFCGATLDDALREAQNLRATPIMSFRATGNPMLFELARRTLNFSDVVADGLRQLDALAMLSEQRANDDLDMLRKDDGKQREWTLDSDELLVGNMVVAVFALAAANELDRLPLKRWRTDIATHTQGARMAELVEHLEGLFVTGEVDAWATVLNCPSTDWSHHAVSALAATLLESLGPDATLETHALWMHYLKPPHLDPLVDHYVSYLISKQWQTLSKSPTLFEAPKRSLPPLHAAINGPGEGWTKARAILRAALNAVPLAPDNNARTTIEGLDA